MERQKTDDLLARFEVLLTSGDSAVCGDFGKICGALGVSRRRMDRILLGELGLDGRTIVRLYTDNIPVSVMGSLPELLAD